MAIRVELFLFFVQARSVVMRFTGAGAGKGEVCCIVTLGHGGHATYGIVDGLSLR